MKILTVPTRMPGTDIISHRSGPDSGFVAILTTSVMNAPLTPQIGEDQLLALAGEVLGIKVKWVEGSSWVRPGSEASRIARPIVSIENPSLN